MYICIDGRIVPAATPVFLPDNKGYRYGDGLFETIKTVNGRMPLWDLHMERLLAGIALLELPWPGSFSVEKLQSDILSLCRRNNCHDLGRVRLSVSRGEGGLHETGRDTLHYLIECSPAADPSGKLNQNGLVAGIFPYAEKSTDKFSGLKSANYLPYTMAARFARQQKWDDCLVLNTNGNIADSTIANIFLVKNDLILTPDAAQGAVDGVMRKYLLEKLRNKGYALQETAVSVEAVKDADELFLTNAVNGIRWVGSLGNKTFTNLVSAAIHREFIQTLWA